MTSFSPLYVYMGFFSDELIKALMYISVNCKYEMNPIKNVREKVMTPFSAL